MAQKLPHRQINEIIHQRTRLAIMATLSPVESLEFNEIKAQLALTDGNLSTHLAALEQAGFVEIDKRFRGKKPLTTVSITDKGRQAMTEYLSLLQKILDQANGPDRGAGSQT